MITLEKKGFWGKVLIWLFLGITLLLFYWAKQNSGGITPFSWLYLSQLAALLGLTLLIISFLMSSRLTFIERLFGGLDVVYKVHHQTATISIIFLLNHPLFLIVESISNWDVVKKYVWFSEIWPQNFGIAGLYTLLLLIVITIFVNLPYSIWKRTHELMGIGLLFVTLHILTVSSDIRYFLPLKSWAYFLLFVGISCVVWRRFLYGWIGPKYQYVVDEIKKRGEIYDIWLKPLKKKIFYFPGQFAFVEFPQLGKEAHPFSFANGVSGRVRFVVKSLGDYTKQLGRIKKDDRAILWGPYGQFGVKEGKQDLIFIAGGIGITPFLSLMEEEIVKNFKRKIDIFYCVRTDSEAVFDTEISRKIKGHKNIHYFKYCSEKSGRISGEVIQKFVDGLRGKKIMICGPVPMMESLATQFMSLGVKRRDIVFEDFSLK